MLLRGSNPPQLQPSNHRPKNGQERGFAVKNAQKKILLLGSFGAMLLSATLLISPANAGILSHCTSCTAISATGAHVTATCHVAPIDACFCPLTGTIVKNNCQFVGAKK
jgi:hypothetical protein